MDFRHLIVTCLFSMLRLSFETQKIKENYAILNIKSGLFYTIATSGLTNAFMTISTSATADTYRCVRDQ